MNANGTSEAILFGVTHTRSDEGLSAALAVTPTVTQQGHRNHYSQFKSYLRRNLIYIQRLVHTADQQLSDEVRTQALHTLSYAMAERDLWPLVRELLLALAPKMELGGHREDWLPYLTQWLDQSRLMADLSAMAECHLQLGLIYRLLSNFGAAREQLVASIALAQESGERRQQARALNELAWLEQLQEEYTVAEEHVQQALRLLDGDDPEVATCYRVQGMIACGYKDWQQAEQLHRHALKRFEQQGDLRRTAWSLQNLAYALREQNNYEEVFSLYFQAIALLEKLNDKCNWAIVKTNLGIAYYHVGKYDLSVTCYQEAESVATGMNDRFHFARICTNLGLVYLSQQEYNKASHAFKQSILLHSELGNTRLSVNAEDGLIMVLLAQSKYHEAIEVAQNALAKLEQIQGSPGYDYLLSSLQFHLKQAQQG